MNTHNLVPFHATGTSRPAEAAGFASLGLVPALLRAISEHGYVTPTPIQGKAIPVVLAGHDLFGSAPTGTGKTLAFALPILQKLVRKPAVSGRRQARVLTLSPTRELTAQIADSFAICGRHTTLKTVAIFGGVSQSSQTRALSTGVDIIVATPGRLWDLIGQHIASLDQIDTLVLDEADRMLDMGFLPDVRRILARIPSKPQTLLFSATMPAPILDFAKTILSAPVQVAVAPIATLAPKIRQGVYFVDRTGKRALLERVLLRDADISRALVFTRTKHGADRVARQLLGASIQAEAIHGNKSQNARTRALDRFRAGSLRVLVATDVAARGLDVDSITHVINYDLPSDPESYVHRIGRTGRAGASGTALSFCSGEERAGLKAIERLIRARLPIISDVSKSEIPRRPTSAPS